MTLNEATKWVQECDLSPSAFAAYEALTAEILRLRTENTALRLYAPARRAQPTVKTPPLTPPNLAFFGIAETDEEFAERAGRKVDEVTE